MDDGDASVGVDEVIPVGGISGDVVRSDLRRIGFGDVDTGLIRWLVIVEGETI